MSLLYFTVEKEVLDDVKRVRDGLRKTKQKDIRKVFLKKHKERP